MGRVINTTGQTVRAGQSNTFKPLAAKEYTVSIYDVEESTYGPKTANAGRDGYSLQLRIADGQEGANRRLFQTIGLFLTWAPTAKNPDGADNFTFYDFFSAIEGVKSKDYRAGVKALVLDKESETYKDDLAAALASIKDEAYRAKIADAVKAGTGLVLPDPAELLGKKINVVLKIVPDTYGFEKAVREDTLEEGQTQQDFLTNDISAWKPFAEVAAAGASAPADAFVL